MYYATQLLLNTIISLPVFLPPDEGINRGPALLQACCRDMIDETQCNKASNSQATRNQVTTFRYTVRKMEQACQHL